MKIKNTNDIPSLVRKFMPTMEQRALIGSVEHDDILKELSERIEKMPKSYETDGQGKAAIVYLHYFKGDSHFYITEKDVEDEQHQAYGLTVLNGDWMNAEMGYISIEELKEYQFELDLFWKPISIKEVRENKEKFSSGGSVEGNAEIEKALMYLQDNLQEKRGEKITKITTAERKENKIKPVWKYEIKEVDEHGNVRPDSDIINRYLSDIGLLEYATENGMKRVSYLTDEKKSNILAAYQYIKKHGAKTAQEKTFLSELGYKKQGTESNYTFSDKGLEQIYERFFKDLPVELQNLSLKFKDGESVYLKNVQNMKGNVGFMNQSNGMWYVKFKDGSDGYFSDEDLEKENGMVNGGAISEDGYYEKISYQNSIKNNLFTVRKFDSSGMEFKTPEFGVFMNGKHIDNARTLQEAKDLINNDTYYSDGGSLDSISSKYPDLKKGQLYTSWYRGEENSFYVYDVDGDDLTIRVNGVNTKKTVKQFEKFIELYKLVPQYKMEEVDLDSISKQEISDAVKQGYNEIRVGVIDRNTMETGVMLVKGNTVFKAYQLKYKAEIADIIKDEKSKEDGGIGVQEPKEITEQEATELFNKGIVVYIQAGHGILDTSQNVFSFSNKSFDASLNMYIGGRHPNEVPFDEILAFIRDREDFDLKFYTLNSERSWILEGGKTFAKGGGVGEYYEKVTTEKGRNFGLSAVESMEGGRKIYHYKWIDAPQNVIEYTKPITTFYNNKPTVDLLDTYADQMTLESKTFKKGGEVEQDEDDKKYIWKHRHTKGITAEILERTKNSFKVKQTEEYEAWGDDKLKTPKVKTEVYKQQEFIDLFTIDRLKPEYLKTGGNMDIRGDKNPNFIYNILRYRKGKRVIVFSGEEQELRDGILEVNPENDKDYDVNGVSFDLSRIDYIVPPLEHGIDCASIYLKLNDKLKTGGDVKKQPEWLFIGQYPNAVVYADKRLDGKESGDYHSIVSVIHEPLEIKVYDKSSKYDDVIKLAKQEYLKRAGEFEHLDVPKRTDDNEQTDIIGYKGYTAVRNIRSTTQGSLLIYKDGKKLDTYSLEIPFNEREKKENRYFLNDGEVREIIDSISNKTKMETTKLDEGGLINTEEIVADPANELEDVSVQNADISAAEYIPKSIVCETLDTVAPVSMLYEMNKSLTKIDREVRGIDQYVMGKLGYTDLIEMCRAFSAEQVDAVANAIYQIEKGQALIVGDMVGIGKGRSQPLDSKVLTKSGWVKMGDLKIGSKVISADGNETVVSGVYPQGKIDVYEVLFTDGTKTECSLDHLWLVKDNQMRDWYKKNPNAFYGQYKVKSLKEIIKYVHRSVSVPTVQPVNFKEQEVPVDPYLLGVLLGDACIRKHGIELTTNDDQILDSVRDCLLKLDSRLCAKKTRHQHYQLSKGKSSKKRNNGGHENKLLTGIRKLGLDGKVANSKFIPDIYKINSVEVRIAILQGLMDTDGYVSKKGGCQYYTVSEQLANDVVFLVQSLGGLARKTIKKTLKQPCHVITIALPNDICPVRLLRKKERVNKRTKYPPIKYIKSINLVGKKECQCISVEHPSHLYVTDDFIVTHNTAAAIMRYSIKIGKTPIFFTAKPNLFSDIYRDLIAIGSDDAVPVWFKGKEIDKVRKVTKTLIENAIKEDIENGDFELDYNSSKLFTKGYEKETEDCVEEYRDLYYPNEIMKESSYTRNDDYAKQIKKSKRIVPFIVNGRSSKTEIKDSDGNVLYEGVSNTKPDYTLRNVFESRKLPKGYDAVLLTYSQVNSPTRAKEKAEWLMAMATDNIVICDESHLASGSSNTGKYLQGLLNRTAGVVFLSATFAKRPDNMPIYAMKTAIQDAEMDNDTLVAAITSGGVALQEILANELVSEGQMLRRERSYEGVVVNYNYLDERMLERDVPLPNFNLRETHEAVSDTVTNIIRKIIGFQKDKVNPIIANKDEEFKEQQIEAGVEKQNIEGGIGNPPIFSGIFNLINQLLFSIKAEAVADFAIQRMKEGKKVIIGFSSTLESFLDYLISEETDKIKTDFSVILKRRLEKTLEYTIKHPTGDTEKMALDPNEYPTLTDDYNDILKDIRKASTGITISPIDVIVKKIKDAGFKIGEVTGRKKQVKFLEDGVHGKIESRVKEPVNDMFRKFNDNELDCLLINQSGSTGASAHSIETKKVYVVNHNEDGTPKIPTSLEPRNEVKQRVMIILQAELDINQEVQKRGRINRTGQVFKPIYDYVISAIPAEERLMMMLQKKLKSLDANTTSNQKQSKKLLDVVDFLNVYGDMKVVQFLKDNPQYNDMTGNILKFEFGNPTEDTNKIEDKAHKVSGRVAILPVELQSNFYKTVSEGYGNLETQLRQSGEWNLEVENMDLDAKLIRKDVVSVGNPEKSSVFGEAVFMERCSVNNLRKPYKQAQVENLIANALTFTTPQGKVLNFNPETKSEFLIKKFLDHVERSKENQLEYAVIRKDNDLIGVKESPSLLKKTKTEAKEYIAEKTAAIELEYENRVKSIESSIKNTKQLVVGNLEYFKVRKLMAYPLAKYDENGEFVKGICLGVDINFNQMNPFAPSQMIVRFVLPNGMRMMSITLSDSFIYKIKAATEGNYEIKTADERDVDTFIEDWDVETKESRADRVNRYIVTGNILKGYGNADFRVGGKLISYTVDGGGVKKGILLPDNFEAKDIRVKIPINKALNFIQGMSNGTSLQLYGTDVTMQRRSNFYHLYVKKAKNPLSDIVNDSDINSFSFEDKWNYSKGEFTNQFELPTIKKLVSILWEKYKINISIPVSAFEAIKDQFDIEEREKSTDDGTEELIKKHNKMLEEYERSKKFTEVDEKELRKYDEIEKENYELKKQVAELEAMKRLYKVTSLLEADIRKKKREAAELAGQAQMKDGGDIDDEEEYLQAKDLFLHQEELPADVKSVLDKYGIEGEATYETCGSMLAELEPLGYTFEYYLDAEPFNLRKI